VSWIRSASLTPFGHRLSNSLENERLRMTNEWFFPWHSLGYGGRVDVDDFNGRRIRIGGVEFSGSAELVYWSTVKRYLANKINDTFAAAEAEIRATSATNAQAIVEDASRLLTPFCQRIVGEAIETDRRLKGKGFPDPRYQSHHAARISFLGDVDARKRSILAFYCRENESKSSLGARVEKFVERNKGKLQITAAIVGILGLGIAALKFFGA
jgi:hypothetical protein